MKLKILSVCSVISLFCAGTICAKDLVVERYNANSNIQSSKKGSIRNNAKVKDGTKSVKVENLRQTFEQNDKAASPSSRSSKANSIRAETMKEVNAITESGRVEKLRQMFEPDEETILDADVLDKKLGKRLVRSESAPDLSEDFIEPRKQKSEDVQLPSYSVFKKFVENLNDEFSELQTEVSDFEKKAESYSSKISDPNVSKEDRKTVSINFNKTKDDLVQRLTDFIAYLKQLRQDGRDLNMGEKIEQLEGYQTKVNELIKDAKAGVKAQRFQRKQDQAQQKQEKINERLKKDKEKRASVKTGPVDWNAIQTYNDDLSDFVKAVRNHKLRFNVVKKYGEKCFDNQDGSLFDPGQEMDPSLKGLSAQIYEVRFPEVLKVWSDIKAMKDEKASGYKDKLEELRLKVEALGKNISSLIRQKSDIDKKGSAVSQPKEKLTQTDELKAKAEQLSVRGNRMREVRAQTKDVDVPAQTRRIERSTRPQTHLDQVFKKGVESPLNEID